MKQMKRLLYVFCLSHLLFACGSPSTVDPDPNALDPDDLSQIDALTVNLHFPHEDGLCNIGVDITPTQSTVFFEWEASTIAESYTIYITNLINGSKIEANTNEDTVGIRLDRATPYSWYVESRSPTQTAESETWKFYNAGPGVETYAPFPATIDAPAMAASVPPGTVTLMWTGSDVDNDIESYDVYFGTDSEPNLHGSNITANTIDVTVASGTIYYWKVVTKDITGNTSESGTFQFRVL
ncbi:hypothetical protein MHTCC0001_11800 [Flavobacteriaceae bacterium MHTCC 0001]